MARKKNPLYQLWDKSWIDLSKVVSISDIRCDYFQSTRVRWGGNDMKSLGPHVVIHFQETDNPSSYFYGGRWAKDTRSAYWYKPTPWGYVDPSYPMFTNEKKHIMETKQWDYCEELDHEIHENNMEDFRQQYEALIAAWKNSK